MRSDAATAQTRRVPTGASRLRQHGSEGTSVCSYSSFTQAVQTQFVSQFAHSHCIGKILFVSKHQNNGVLQLVLLDLMTSWTQRVM